MKVALLWPDPTVTLEGTVRLALLLASDTANPLPDAVPVNATEYDVLPGVLMVELVQLRVPRVTATGREIPPEPPVEGTATPPAVVATTLLS